MTRSMRRDMPACFAFIQSMREAFGKDEIDAAIKAGIAGKPVFWASEAGYEVGTAWLVEPGRRVVAVRQDTSSRKGGQG